REAIEQNLTARAEVAACSIHHMLLGSAILLERTVSSIDFAQLVESLRIRWRLSSATNVTNEEPSTGAEGSTIGGDPGKGAVREDVFQRRGIADLADRGFSRHSRYPPRQGKRPG